MPDAASSAAHQQEVSSLKVELEAAHAKAEAEAKRVREVEEQMRALQEHLASQPPPRVPTPPKESPQVVQPAVESTKAGTGGPGATQGPSREEWVQILEASPLASMQSKLAVVEDLLRTLLSERTGV